MQSLHKEKIGYILNSFPELRNELAKNESIKLRGKEKPTDFNPGCVKAPDGAKTDQIGFHPGKKSG